MVTKEQLISALKALGLQVGDICLFHSSFKSFGGVMGGGETVIGALESVLGKEGTLVAPTLCSTDFGNCYKTWYMDKPSEVGYLPEYFRKQPFVYRSDHATHSVAARGKLAYQLTFEHGWRGPHLCPFGEYTFADSSPWAKMDALNAKVLFIGVNMRFHTMKHLVEGRMVEYFLSKVEDEQKRQALQGQIKRFGVKGGFWPYYSSVSMQERLEEMGLVSHGRCGDAELILVEAQKANEAALHILINEYKDWFDETVCGWIDQCLTAQ